MPNKTPRRIWVKPWQFQSSSSIAPMAGGLRSSHFVDFLRFGRLGLTVLAIPMMPMITSSGSVWLVVGALCSRSKSRQKVQGSEATARLTRRYPAFPSITLHVFNPSPTNPISPKPLNPYKPDKPKTLQACQLCTPTLQNPDKPQAAVPILWTSAKP